MSACAGTGAWASRPEPRPTLAEDGDLTEGAREGRGGDPDTIGRLQPDHPSGIERRPGAVSLKADFHVPGRVAR